MIKHVTVWKLKDFACGNDKETNYVLSRDLTYEMMKEFPKLLHAEIGRGFTVGKNRYDLCKIFTFATKEDLEEFLKSPIHAKYKEFNDQIREASVVVDYEVEDEH